MCDEQRIRELERLLQDLTPGGSDFQHPERCAAYVRREISNGIKQNVEAMARVNSAEQRLSDNQRSAKEADRKLQLAIQWAIELSRCLSNRGLYEFRGDLGDIINSCNQAISDLGKIRAGGQG